MRSRELQSCFSSTRQIQPCRKLNNTIWGEIALLVNSPIFVSVYGVHRLHEVVIRF